MTTQPAAVPAARDSQSTANLVHMLMHFVRVSRYRKGVLIGWLLVAGALGLLYYATATRIFEATAQLLVLQSGSEVWTSRTMSDASRQSQMPTYERLFTTAVVLNGAINRILAMPPEYRVDLAPHPPEQWHQVLRDNLTARTARKANIIELSYQSKSPKAAAAVVTAIVNAYLEFMEPNHKNVTAEIVAILDKERTEVENRLMTKERELLDAKARSGDIGIQSDKEAIHPLVNRAVKLNEILVQAQQRRVELEATLAAVRAAIAQGGNLRQHLASVEPTIGRQIMLTSLGMSDRDIELMATLEKKMLEDQAAIRSLREHFGPAHPRIVELVESIRAIEAHLGQFRSKMNLANSSVDDREVGPLLLTIVQEELARAWQHENKLQQEYALVEQEAVALNGRLAEVKIIEHDLQLLQNLHDVLLNRIANIDIDKNQADLRVAVVSEPQVPRSPVSPQLSLVALMALAGGFGVGSVIVYALDVLDDRFRTPEEMRDELGVPILAMIRQLPQRDGVGIETLQVLTAGDSIESEAFRTLRTTLAFSGADYHRLVVSSSEPGDGKTTVMANLAASFALAGKKTLVIDADLRRPGLTNLFQLRAVGGLSDVLRSDEPIAAGCVQRIRATGQEGLDILPCGPRPLDPSELLSHPRMGDLLAWAETIYDQILIDTPPVLAASDAAIVGRIVDGVLLVVQPEKNHRRSVIRAVENLQVLGVNLRGTIVNRVGGEGSSGLYGRDSAYGYGYGYGHGYGYGADDEDPHDGTLDDTGAPPLSVHLEAADNEHRDDGHIAPRRVA